MKKNILKTILISTSTIALLSGCTGNEVLPNNATQTGAVTGALAGSVIGYNTKGSNRGQRAVIGGLLGAAAGGAIGSAVDTNTAPAEDTSGWQ